MRRVQVGRFAIQIIDHRSGNLIARHAQEKKEENNMSTIHHLTEADIAVARALGVNLKDVSALKYAHGQGGLNGVALLADERSKSPFGTLPPKYVPTNPGLLTDEGGVPVRTIIEPEDSDSEHPSRTLLDPRAGVEVGISFPSERKKGASK
jgi:hypothetical protein